ncbi:MAG: radical SAM protein, partial [Euryarchaeota archaeon]|nr:radical SAM protein [Euryarchaeota archaeon]
MPDHTLSFHSILHISGSTWGKRIPMPMDLTMRFVDRLADRVASNVSFVRVRRLEDVLPDRAEKVALNIRVPFCAQRCTYCALPGEGYDERMARIFLAGLNEELRIYAEYIGRTTVERVYLSGGTPSLMHEELGILVDIIKDHFDLQGKMAMEASPTDLSDPVMDNLRSAKVSQLSIGVQTFNERILNERLGRGSSRSELVETLRRVMSSGFEYVNIDLMFSLPGQNLEDIVDDLGTASNLGIDGISTYPLMLLPYTPLTMRMSQESGAENGLEDPAGEKAKYLAIVRTMRESGYKLRTLWSFSKRPEEYEGPYEHGNFLGLGPRAWGMVNNRLTVNSPSVLYYAKMLEEGFLPIFAFSEMKDYPVARFARRLYYGRIGVKETEELRQQDPQVGRYLGLMRVLGLVSKEGGDLIFTDKALAYGSHATKKI